MQLSLPHHTTKELAKERIVELLVRHERDIAQNASDVKTAWSGDVLAFSFVAQGSALSGTLVVHDNEYELSVMLPLKYRLFEGTIERMIKKEVEKLSTQS